MSAKIGHIFLSSIKGYLSFNVYRKISCFQILDAIIIKYHLFMRVNLYQRILSKNIFSQVGAASFCDDSKI